MYECKEWSSNFDQIFFVQNTAKSCSEWTRIWMAENQSWCASGFNSWFIIFLIYTNDLLDNPESNVMLFANSTSMFLVVSDSMKIFQKLNKDFDKVGLWANKWKMSLNSDALKQL